MKELLDTISLFSSVSLGLLAAALTLLAIYPAIGVIVSQRLAGATGSVVLEHDRVRKRVFWALGLSIAFSWSALLVGLVCAVAATFETETRLLPHFNLIRSQDVLEAWEIILMALTFGLTALSLVLVAIAAWFIFRATTDNA